MAELSNATTISAGVSLFNPARVFTKSVTVAPKAPETGTASPVAVVKGTLAVADGKGKYTPIATSENLTTAVPANRVVVLVEDGTAAAAGTTFKAIVSGQVYINGLVAAGYDLTKVPEWVLDIVGGISNITFADEEEA